MGTRNNRHEVATLEYWKERRPANRSGREYPLRRRGLRRFGRALPVAWASNESWGDPKRRRGGCALDVWENEPSPNPELVELADIATPHIAGYSFDGKAGGILALHRALCGFLGVEPNWLPPAQSGARHGALVFDTAVENPVGDAVAHAYDIGQDDRALRKIASGPAGSMAAEFRAYRMTYRRRLEFSNVNISVDGLDPSVLSVLLGLGFSA